MRILTFFFLVICAATRAQVITSPDKNVTLKFSLDAKGTPVYELSYKQKPVILPSTLGLEIQSENSFLDGFAITDSKETAVDETWNPIMGEQKTIRSNYNELLVTLAQKQYNDRYIRIRFRLFNDGLGFRYEFPQQQHLNYFVIREERTQFNLNGDHKAWWMPGDYDTNEYPYTTSNLSELPAVMPKATIGIHAQQVIKNLSVQTPLMLKSKDGIYINIHEAALID